jgi:hypothetical protein
MLGTMAFTLFGRLLDIEWLLLRDEGRPADEVLRHDRQLLGNAQPADAEEALRLWLEGRRRELDHRTLGVRVSELLGALHLALVASALAAGAGTAGALLRGPAAHEPTNVLHFVFATLGWPLLLLLASLLAFSLHGRRGRSVLLEDVYLRLLSVVGRLARGRAHEDWDLAHEWRRVRRAGRRYRDLEIGTLVSAAQWYALSFHLGAAGCLLASALFSELAFSWSTTDDSLHWTTLAATFGALSTPWCRALDVGCVSAELVRATQFSRFTGQYVLPQGVALSGAWWPALLFCLLVYGVLPRLAFSLALSAFVERRATHLSERVLELRGRLRAGVDVLASRTGPRPDGAEPAPAPRAPAADLALTRTCWLIRWRGAALDDSALSAFCRRMGLEVVRSDEAGSSDFASDDALLAEPGANAQAVLLLAEGWEAPDKATRRFVQTLRRHGAADRPVFVCVLLPGATAPANRAGSSDPLVLWRDRLRLLQDPFVSVDAVVLSDDRSRSRPEGVA